MSVSIDLDDEDAERIEHGICDLLCWLRGYRAARPDQVDDHPIGVSALRELSLALKDARQVEEAPPVFRRRTAANWERVDAIVRRMIAEAGVPRRISAGE